MGFNRVPGRKKFDKKFMSKNQTLKLYKQKHSKIELFRKEVEELRKKYNEPIDIKSFADFPLTYKTKKALSNCGYICPTEIQKESILLALKSNDILGAAKTGSGKTLAFVIPVLERLYCSGWSILDGLGAIIITPTRELAYQIFEVMNKVGANHTFSAALVIGGKDLAKERKLLDKCNILICTPGRLLQHMDENPLFDASNLKMLVLDEADRILDLGFEKTLNAILENLPEDRQTLLFSATQTKSVKDLARLSLKNPVYVSVHEHAKHTTPENLQQSYVVCEAHDKVNLIWSFIKSHKKQKILVFMSSCKQVKFMFESFCRLRPGVSLMALYGSLHQLRRMQIYDEFCKKNHVVMFATDVASRGLDFPNVNWVVQLDCPEDVNTYIHRAGRTARFEKGGEALLVLLPSEETSMVEQLGKRKIPIEKISVNPEKLHSIQRKLDTILARDDTLMDSGDRAFKAYLKNMFLMKDKSIFDVTKVDVNLYAKSLGLSFVPRIRFLEKRLKGFTHPSTVKTEPSSQGIGSSLLDCANDASDSDDDMLQVKKSSLLDSIPKQKVDDDGDQKEVSKKKPLTKAALAKRALKKKIKPNTVVKFDDEGKAIREICGVSVPVVAADIEEEILAEGYSVEKAKLLKEREDEVDKIIFKDKIKAKHRDERLKLKKQKLEKFPGGATAVLSEAASDSDEESPVDPNNMCPSEDDDESSEESQSDVSKDLTESDQEQKSVESYKEDRVVKFSKSRKRKFDENDISAKKVARTIEDDEQLALHLLSNDPF